MDYGGGELSRFDYARYLSACLAYLSNRQRDRVGLVTVAGGIVDRVPPSMKHLETILGVLDRSRPEGRGSLCKALTQVTELLKRRGIVAVISDFYEDADELLAALGGLRARGHDIIAFHPIDPSELDFPFEDASAFEGLEDEEQIPVIPKQVRSEYIAHIANHIDALGRGLTELQADYARVSIAEPLDRALFDYLLARGRRARRARRRLG